MSCRSPGPSDGHIWRRMWRPPRSSSPSRTWLASRKRHLPVRRRGSATPTCRRSTGEPPHSSPGTAGCACLVLGQTSGLSCCRLLGILLARLAVGLCDKRLAVGPAKGANEQQDREQDAPRGGHELLGHRIGGG